MLIAPECAKQFPPNGAAARFEARLPQPEPEFLANSVLFAGARWESLCRDVKAGPSARLLVMPDELAPIPDGMKYGDKPVDAARRPCTRTGKAPLSVSLGRRRR
jgi:hypothetical protein